MLQGRLLKTVGMLGFLVVGVLNLAMNPDLATGAKAQVDCNDDGICCTNGQDPCCVNGTWTCTCGG